LLDLASDPCAEEDRDSRRWLYRRGHYCVVRRFSSKEERRRLVASVVSDMLHTDTKFS
jgi:hypothetical protein